ncbi:MAG TPA: 6-bladed beta-propeller [Candidatus Latescibacteria bacterium]|nr:6-bladed beta-propeller [Candidatus Latescibacterota bacterium]
MSYDTDSRFGAGFCRVSVLVLFFAAGAVRLSLAVSLPETAVTKIIVIPLPSRTKEIRLLRFFPTEKDEAQGVFFSRAQDISLDPQGRIYVTDVKANQVLVFDAEGRFIRKIGGPGQGPGEFDMAGRALWTSSGLAVLDRSNSRVQYFDDRGWFSKSLKLTKSYIEMAIGTDGTIFAFNMRGGPGGMIDAIDADGRAHTSYGNPPQALSDGASPRVCWLSMSPRDELFVAYWFSPVVQVYSAAGELRSVFEIQYKPMQDKLARNPANSKTTAGGARVIGQSIIEAIWATGEGFFVLHRDSAGRIDILEFSRAGTFVRDYWSAQSPEYYPRGLVIRENAGKKVFYLPQTVPENRVDIFIEK